MYLAAMANQSLRTTTAEALLGVLSLRPMSGYQIRQQIEQSIGNFWQESYGQIYPTLKRLRAERLVTIEEAEGRRSRAESKVYSLTETGRERVMRWIGTPSLPRVPRNEMLLKIFFGEMVPLETVREQVRDFRARHEAQLLRFAGIEQWMRSEHGHDPRMPFWLMTLRYGQAESQAMVAWAEETLRTCDALGEPVSGEGRPEEAVAVAAV